MAMQPTNAPANPEINKPRSTKDPMYIDDKDLLEKLGAFAEGLTVDSDSFYKGDSEKEIDTVDGLALYVKERFRLAESGRSEIEQEWLKDLRQYKGEYDPEVLSRIDVNRSKAFIRTTRTKVRTVDARLMDFLFPVNGEKNWSVETTPIPDVDVDSLLADKQAQGVNISPEQAEFEVNKIVKDRALKMERRMEDQLAECNFREVIKEVVHSGNQFGTGVLKGPLVNFVKHRQYVKQSTENQRWVLQHFDKLTPYVDHVPVWDIYPDLSATKREDCRYIIQRHRKDKHELVELARRKDFNGAVIRDHLAHFPGGDVEQKTHEADLKALGKISGSEADNSNKNKKYEVLEFWGYVDAVDLEEAGVDIPDNLRESLELAAVIWVLGSKVIKASLAPLEGVIWPFYFYYYDKDETSIFGEGIPRIMRDVQELTNSAFRAMLDNAAISAGPQFEVNLRLLSDDEDPTDIRPFKVWTRTGEGYDAASPAVRIMEPPSYTNNYLKMCEAFEKYGDEVTTIPRYMWGDQAGGAGRTSSGLSMMMGSANITIKDQVKNFDIGILEPFITALYHWNMQFGDNDDVKGDYTIKANGTASLIAKEVYAQSLMQFANITNNPTDLPTVKRVNIIRGIAESLDLGDRDLILSDNEIQVNNQQREQAAAQERQWMTQMVEAARKYGVSPTDMIDNLKSLKTELDQAPAQQVA